MVLTLSLGFNLFFLTGYIKSQKTAEKISSPKERIEAAAQKVGLDEKQKTALMHIFSQSRQKQMQLRKKRAAAVKTFKLEFKKPQPDITRLRTLLQNLENEQKKFHKEVKQQWKHFFATLTPKQQKAVRKLLKKRPHLYRKLLFNAS